MNEKITNCSRCGTNPWKRGCYAMWGKSPESLLYKKGEDNGYICSVCANKSCIDNNNFVMAEKYYSCPIYGKKTDDMEHSFTTTNPITDETTRFKCGASFNKDFGKEAERVKSPEEAMIEVLFDDKDKDKR